MAVATRRLAIHGGPKAVQTDPGDMFAWPIITEEDEQAVLEVLRAGKMSGTEVTMAFEKEFAAWHGVRWTSRPCGAGRLSSSEPSICCSVQSRL